MMDSEGGGAEAYELLQPVLTRPIDWDLIRRQYDQMIKYTTALRLGAAETEAILRRFTRTNVQHPTYKALAELGKAIKWPLVTRLLGEPPETTMAARGATIVRNMGTISGIGV
jgi:TnpA family transposase